MRTPVRFLWQPRPAVLLLLALLGVVGETAGAVEAPPRRVVSLAPSLTEMVFALGAGDRLVGVTSYCNYPETATRLPKIGGIEDGNINLERVLALKPDLVVAIGEGQQTTVDALRRLGLRVEVVSSQTFDDVFGSITRMGGLLGRVAAAKRLTGDLERRIERIRKTIALLPRERRPRVFYEVWDRPLMTATSETLIGRLIELAGGINIFGDLSGRFVQVSPEAVLKRNPQAILAPDTHLTLVDRHSLMQLPGFSHLEAVRRGRILILDGDLVSRAGPRIADALELLARALHPDLFPAPARRVAPAVIHR
jgi:iron complex transport system substrate-binding protein